MIYSPHSFSCQSSIAFFPRLTLPGQPRAFVTVSTETTNVARRCWAPRSRTPQPHPAACAVLPRRNFYPFTLFFRLAEQQLSCLYSPPPVLLYLKD